MSNEMNNEIARRGAGARDMVSSLAGDDSLVFTSIDRTNRDGAIALFNAMSDSESLNEHLGETIMLKDFVAEVIEIEDNVTKEPISVVRTVLIDDKGTAYHAISDQLVRALRRMFTLTGDPSTWAEPTPIIVTEQRGKGPNRFFQVKIAGPAATATAKGK